MTRRAALVLLVLAGCSPGEPPVEHADGSAPDASAPPPARPLLVEATAASGLAFVHVNGARGNRELPETVGGGVAVIDHDGDGLQDLYFAQSGPPRTPGGGESRAGAENELWRNLGGARFEAVPGAAGAADDGFGMGCAAGDFDGDGRDDLLALNWGRDRLYRNLGGRFEDASDAAGLPADDRWTISAAFFDAEGDGDLDLYVVGYLVCPPASHTDPAFDSTDRRAPEPFAFYPHPSLFDAAPDRFLVNRGDGRFEERTREAGLDVPPGKGMGATTTDVELDGLLDLYVSNDSTPNFLFRNRRGPDGAPTFEEAGGRTGAAFDRTGRPEAGMGVDSADVDGDGDLDLFVTNLDEETNTLYVNERTAGAALALRDRTTLLGLSEPSLLLVGFGALFFDADRDADPDLLVANGHIIDNVTRLADSLRYAQPDQLLLLGADGRYAEAAPELAPGLERPTVSRGTACGDLDNDGDLDFVIAANGGPARLFLGQPPDAPWLSLRLDGPRGNPHGLGATVFLELAGGRTVLGRVESSRSYASASEPVWCVGLPAPVAAVEVLWPGGRRERWAELGGSFEGEQRLAHGGGVPAPERAR